MSLPPATEGTCPGPESSPRLGHTWNLCLNPSQPRAQPRTSPAWSQIPNHSFTNRNTTSGLFEFTKYPSTHITSFDQCPILTDFTGLLLCAGHWAYENGGPALMMTCRSPGCLSRPLSCRYYFYAHGQGRKLGAKEITYWPKATKPAKKNPRPRASSSEPTS